MITNGKKYLVSTNDWFLAPSGYQCKAAYGVCEIIKSEDAFGFTPQRPSTNWFLKIGIGDKSILIAGCHIHYAIETETRPTEIADRYVEKDTYLSAPVNKIYFTE